MPNQDYPVLDGIAPSWADIGVKCSVFDGALFDVKDIAAINTSTTLEVGNQNAPGGRIRKRTTGSLTQEASMTLYQDGWNRFMRNLVAVAPRRGKQALIRHVHFNVQVQFTPEGADEIFEYLIKGCFVSGRALNGAEGTDPNKIEVSLNTIEIVDILDGVEVTLI